MNTKITDYIEKVTETLELAMRYYRDGDFHRSGTIAYLRNAAEAYEHFGYDVPETFQDYADELGIDLYLGGK